MTSPIMVGLDIGGTKVDAVAIEEDGRIIQRIRMATGFGHEAVLETARAAVVQLSELTGTAVSDFESIGIGIPGAVEEGTGRIAHSVNLGLADFELGSELGDLLGREVRIDNDVNAAALGAFRLLEHGSTHSMAYLNLGTGLAAGLVLNGSLWRGSRGGAGEIGHIPVDPAGIECPCGQRGCLEMVGSGSAIARQWPTDDPRPASALFEAASLGDPAAIEVRDRFIEAVASAIRLLVLTFDVDSVVIGGGLSALGDDLLERIAGVLTRWEAASPFLASIGLSSRVQLVPAGFPAAAVGAALVGTER